MRAYLATLFFAATTEAFTSPAFIAPFNTPLSLQSSKIRNPRSCFYQLQSTSVGSDNDSEESIAVTNFQGEPPNDEDEASWEKLLSSAEVQEVRQELIEKFVSQGQTVEFAEFEVAKFLSSPEQCGQFLEMRRYAKAQQAALDDPMSYVMLGGAFFVGLAGQFGFQVFHKWQEMNP